MAAAAYIDAVRQMIDRGAGGAVLNISSVRANLGINAGYSGYVAAKGAVSSLTRQWATEWAKHGIRVNALAPDITTTEGLAALSESPTASDRLARIIPLGRPGHVDDLAGAAVFLASDLSGYLTGQTLFVDGGTEAAGGWYHHPDGTGYQLGPDETGETV